MARRRRQEVFVLDPLQVPNTAVGIKLPFSSKTGKLFQQSYSTEEQAISNLKNLLLTRKGERYMQPEFGTDIYDYLFDNNVEELPIVLSESIATAISFWLPYIIINDLTVTPTTRYESEPIGHSVQISLTVQASQNGANVPITINLTPNGITVQ